MKGSAARLGGSLRVTRIGIAMRHPKLPRDRISSDAVVENVELLKRLKSAVQELDILHYGVP